MIRAAARRSPLSLTQVDEVFSKLSHPFELIAVDSRGDLDRTSSLRHLAKDDFFTDAVDRLVLEGRADVGIHSAKDLPDPLTPGLSLIALTKGLDPSDSLVLRPNETVQPHFRIATSSARREELVQQLFPFPLHFLDLRGTIAERLDLLTQGAADGIVVAEAALIRLGLTHLSRIRLPGPTVPLQGRLAVTARTGDEAMRAIFEVIHDHSLSRA